MSARVFSSLRVVALLAVLAGLLGPGSGAASAQGLQGDVFTDEANGWSVTFDDTVWEGDEIEGDAFAGINLTSDYGLVTLVVYDDGITEVDACLDDLARVYVDGDSRWDDLEPAPDLDTPDAPRGAEAEIYRGRVLVFDEVKPAVLYLECRALEDATLTAAVTVFEEDYEGSLPFVDELLAGVETDVAGSDDPDGDDPDGDDPDGDDPEGRDGLHGDAFTSADYGWSVAWDDRLWEVTEIDTDTYVGVRLTLEGVGFVDVGVYDDLEGFDAKGCMEALDAFYTGSDSWEDLGPARRLDLPETDADAEVALYEGTAVLDDGDEFEGILYLECRDADGAALSIELTALADAYEDAIPDLEDLLAGVEIGGADDRDNGDDDGPLGPREDDASRDQGDDRDQDEETESGLSGNVYTDGDHGWSVEFDEAFWQDVQVIDESARHGIALGGGDAYVNLIVYPEGPDEVDGCFDLVEDVYTSAEEWQDLEPARRLDAPATVDAAVGELYTGALVVDGDALDAVLYLECRPVGDVALAITATVLAESYDAQLADVQALLDGIDTDAGS